MAGPGHCRDHHPVLGAAHSWRVGLQHRLHRAHIQRPPAASTLPLVIARAAPPAYPAAALLPPHRMHMSDQQGLLLVELDPLDDGLLDPRAAQRIPSQCARRSPPLIDPSCGNWNRRQGPACRPLTLRHPRMRQKSSLLPFFVT